MEKVSTELHRREGLVIGLSTVHDITGGLSNPRVVVFYVTGQYFGYSRMGYLGQSESCGGTDQRTPFSEEREKALRS